MNIKKQIAKEIVRVRKDMHLTQEEFAKRVGMFQPNIARLENGRLVSLITLQSIAKALGYHLEVKFIKNES